MKRNKIDDYICNDLFTKRTSGIQSALSDWYPLPRSRERTSPPEYSLIDWKKYSKAFAKPFHQKNVQDTFTCYTDDARYRAQALQLLVRQSNVNVIIGFGKIGIKAILLQNLFPGTEFVQPSSYVLPNHKALQATLDIEGKKVYAILLPFPDPSTNSWNGILKEEKYSKLLKYFAEMVQKYIKPKIY